MLKYFVLGRSSSPRLFHKGLTCTGGSRLVPRGFSIFSHYARQRGDSFNIIAAVTVVGNGGSQFQVCTHPCTVLNWARIKAGLPGIFCKMKLPRFLLVWQSGFQIVDNSTFFVLFLSGNLTKADDKDQHCLQGLDFKHSLMLLNLGITRVKFWCRPFADAQLQLQHEQEGNPHFIQINWYPKSNQQGNYLHSLSLFNRRQATRNSAN